MLIFQNVHWCYLPAPSPTCIFWGWKQNITEEHGPWFLSV